MKAALYTRVSTDEQAEHGFSLEAQKKRLIEYCNKNNIEIYKLYSDEGISGHSIIKRKALQEMLQDAKEHKFNYVIAYKTDRISRNLLDLLTIKNQLDEADVELLLSDEAIDTKDDAGMTMFSIMGAFAELERKKITERMMAGKRQKLMNEHIKLKNGRVPYGYLYDDENKRYVIDESRRQIVELIYKLASQGWSYNKITRHIAEETAANSSDSKKKWYISDIRAILTNPMYKGYSGISYYYNFNDRAKKPKNSAILYKATNVEPYFTEEYWDTLYSQLEKKTQYFKRKHPIDSYIFSDVLFCATCGLKIGTRQHHSNYLYYVCNSKHKMYDNEHVCDYAININKFNNWFIDFIKGIDENNIKLSVSRPKDLDKELQAVRSQISLKEKNREVLLDKLMNGVIDDTEYRLASNMVIASLNSLKSQEKELSDKMDSLKEKEQTKRYNRLKIKALKVLVNDWDNLTDQAKKTLINSSINKIMITKDGIQEIEFN